MQGSASGIRWETRGAVLVATIDRQHRRNALDPEAHHQLSGLFDRFAGDASLLVAVITGAGDKAFCSGSDLSVEEGLCRGNLPETGFAGLAERFDLVKPVIAAVNGDAIGGGLEIVLACDLCVAVRQARFGLPEPKVGLAASGGLHRLARHVPDKRAKELALTGGLFTAEDAHGFGIVNRICEGASALDAALELAAEICANAPLAVRATKQMIDRGLAEPDLESAFKASYPEFGRMAGSEDAKEGRRAFLEKRPPVWRGE